MPFPKSKAIKKATPLRVTARHGDKTPAEVAEHQDPLIADLGEDGFKLALKASEIGEDARDLASALNWDESKVRGLLGDKKIKRAIRHVCRTSSLNQKMLLDFVRDKIFDESLDEKTRVQYVNIAQKSFQQGGVTINNLEINFSNIQQSIRAADFGSILERAVELNPEGPAQFLLSGAIEAAKARRDFFNGDAPLEAKKITQRAEAGDE